MTYQTISFWFFVSAVVMVGVYFCRIVEPFVLPLLMAGTMALLIQPIFSRVVPMVGGRRRVAAGIVSVGAALLLVLPGLLALTFATQELVRYGEKVIDQSRSVKEVPVPIESMAVVNDIEDWLAPYLTRSNIRDVQNNALELARSALAEISKKTTGFLADLVSFAIGLAIMMLGFYYFLAEGPTIAENIEKVLPFEPQDEVAVVKQFETICRGVVLGTFAAALVQAALVGIAFGYLQIPGTWFLVCVTAVFAMIPLVGAGSVYAPVAAYLIWNERYAEGICLLLYGAFLVSTVDNLIRAHMIHGTSRLHPLVAIVSALGAIKIVGLWGIFVGPVVAGIFYALLKILQQKLKRLEPNRAALEPSSARRDLSLTEISPT